MTKSQNQNIDLDKLLSTNKKININLDKNVKKTKPRENKLTRKSGGVKKSKSKNIKVTVEKKPSQKILIGEIEKLDTEKRFNLKSLTRTNIDNLICIRDLLKVLS